MSDVILRIEPLQLTLERLHRFEIEQLAQFGVSDQLAQLCLIDNECLRAALGKRCIAVVKEACDVAEQERRGKWRRLFGIDRDNLNLAAANLGQRVNQR